MTDFQGQIESERGKLKELLLKVPGFKGYIEMEDRRTADKLLREMVADRYQEVLDKLTGIQNEFTDRGDLGYLDDLETIVVKIRTFIDRIRHAAYGYSSFFSAIKIDAEKLDRLYDYDAALLAGTEEMAAIMDNLASAVEGDQIKGFITELKNLAGEMVKKVDQRKEEITSEDEALGDDLIPNP
jgi:methyl-accepting chemotaxis protein